VSKHVLFDLDGTLLDTARDFTQVLNQLLRQYGRSDVSHSKVKEKVSDGARALVKLGFEIDESHENFNAYLQELLDIYAIKITNTEAELYQGIPELLNRINAENYKWGIVTNKPSRFTTPLLKNYSVIQDSAVVICADQVSQGKPSPESLFLACDNLKIEPKECIYVGDHKRDIDAGKNANIETVAVSWGYFKKNTQLKEWNPDLIVNTPQEIAAYLFD
jgi:N-acetyl-D-muramate 6-phosphate phosphatase